MRTLALAAIRLYQRFVSPHKGFACAYRVHTGRCSCSQLGFRAIRRFGVTKGWGLLRQRTGLCGVAHRRFTPLRPRPPARERGDCDLPCDFDISPSPGKWGWCDFLSCCDFGSCGGSDAKKKRKAEDKVYLPPRSQRNG